MQRGHDWKGRGHLGTIFGVPKEDTLTQMELIQVCVGTQSNFSRQIPHFANLNQVFNVPKANQILTTMLDIE